MYKIERFEEDYEHRGELLEDFPGAFDIEPLYHDVSRGLTRFEFLVKMPAHKPTCIEKHREARKEIVKPKGNRSDCADCAHWRSYCRGGDRGECETLGIICTHDFGCKEFKKKQ